MQKGGRKWTRLARRIAGVPVLGLVLIASWIVVTHRQARLDLKDPDDSHTAGKTIGLTPASGEVYATSVGWVDPTVFYQARVTPDEVTWLKDAPQVAAIEARHAPLWWQFWVWWDGAVGGDMKYYRSQAKWPVVFAYSREQGHVYGTVELE